MCVHVFRSTSISNPYFWSDRTDFILNKAFGEIRFVPRVGTCCPYVGVDAVVSLLCAGLCPDWETWDPVKPVENATEAMQLADEWLGIPQVRVPLILNFI